MAVSGTGFWKKLSEQLTTAWKGLRGAGEVVGKEAGVVYTKANNHLVKHGVEKTVDGIIESHPLGVGMGVAAAGAVTGAALINTHNNNKRHFQDRILAERARAAGLDRGV